MEEKRFDAALKALGQERTRRQGIGAAVGALVGMASVPALAREKKKGDGKQGDGKQGDGNPGGEGGPKPGTSGKGRVGAQGPCGDGSVQANRCMKDSECCTNLCQRDLQNKDKNGRCRCQRTGDACSSSSNCCNSGKCQGGICVSGSGGAGTTGPTGPIGPIGPAGTGSGSGSTGPTGDAGLTGDPGATGSDSTVTGPTGATGAAGSPTGGNGSVQYNADGSLAGDAGLVWDYASSGSTRLLVSNVDGAAAANILTVQGANGQTGPLTVYQTSAGSELLRLDSDAPSNVWIGFESGLENVIADGDSYAGHRNTGLGYEALRTNTNGGLNTAVGYRALSKNISGFENTASGYWALSNNTGQSNTATGSQALFENRFGSYNTASGQGALTNNIDGNANTVTGRYAMTTNSSGNSNAAFGADALSSNIRGDNNCAFGADAISTATGSNNIGIGYQVRLPDGTGSNQLTIGNLIYGTDVDGTGTAISTGNIGIGVKAPSERLEVDGNVLATNVTVPSDATLKTGIAPLENALGTIAALRPVTYEWKDTGRFGGHRENGLIAQDVAPVIPSVVHGGGDRTYSLDYAKLVPVLIKAVQEQQTQIQALVAEVADLKG
jgi:hypothetical protein